MGKKMRMPLFITTAKMTARIVLAPNYPAVAPIFCLNIHWHGNRNANNDIHVQVRIGRHFVYLIKSLT